MTLISDFRATISDVNTPYRYEDAELTSFLQLSLDELNGYNQSLLTLNNVETGTNTPIWFKAILLLRGKIYVLESEHANTANFVKFATQDSVRDPGDQGIRLYRALEGLRKEYVGRVKYFIGLDISKALGVTISFTKDIGDANLL